MSTILRRGLVLLSAGEYRMDPKLWRPGESRLVRNSTSQTVPPGRLITEEWKAHPWGTWGQRPKRLRANTNFKTTCIIHICVNFAHGAGVEDLATHIRLNPATCLHFQAPTPAQALPTGQPWSPNGLFPCPAFHCPRSSPSELWKLKSNCVTFLASETHRKL